MSLSLRGRLFFTHAWIVLAALGLFTALVSVQQKRWIAGRSAETLVRLARIAAVDFASRAPAAEGDWNGVAHEVAKVFDVRVTLIARNGTVLGDSDVPRNRLSEVGNHADRPEVRAALAGGVGESRRRSATIAQELHYVAVPVEVPPVAVLRLAAPVADDSSLLGSLVLLSLGAAAAALLATLLITFLVTGRQTARVTALEAVARRLGDGDGARAQEIPADELGRLGRALNVVAGELEQRLDALRRERDERETILAHMTDGVALLDADGRTVRANRSLAAILGAPLPPAPGTSFVSFARAPELDALIADARARGETTETEIRLWTPAQRLVRATATPLGAGERAGLLLVLHDLTETERVDRVRKDFVANVSHELRTPLTSLRGYAETLADGGLDDAEHRESFVHIIRDQARRLSALVEDLLTLAAVEQPGATAHRTPFDLRELAAQQIAAFRQQAERDELELSLVPGGAVPVTADRAQLEQVLANLLDNAIKYTDRGAVTVRLGVAGGSAWCEVEDTGSGIPEDDQPRVFERFYRVDKARSREKGGTGLGLSIVKHIVVLHGGTVTVRSTPGAGSTFRFELPAG